MAVCQGTASWFSSQCKSCAEVGNGLRWLLRLALLLREIHNLENINQTMFWLHTITSTVAEAGMAVLTRMASGRSPKRPLHDFSKNGSTFLFPHGLFGRSTRGPSAPASYTALQRGCSGSAGRQAVVQDVPQMRCLRARHGGMDWRRPEQSGSKRVLHSHTEQAPPPPVPALGGSSSERKVRERTSCATRRSDSSFQRPPVSHAQPSWSSPKELGVGSVLAAFGDGQGSTVPGG